MENHSGRQKYPPIELNKQLPLKEIYLKTLYSKTTMFIY